MKPRTCAALLLAVFLFAGCEKNAPVRTGPPEERPVLEAPMTREEEATLLLEIHDALRVYDTVAGAKAVDAWLEENPLTEAHVEEALRAYLEKEKRRVIAQALEQEGLVPSEEAIEQVASRIGQERLFVLAFSLEKRRLGLD